MRTLRCGHSQQVQAKYNAAARTLQEEKATLTRFDDELQALEETVKAKKQAITDVDIAVQQATHELGQLDKEKTANEGVLTKLENTYKWIEGEKK